MYLLDIEPLDLGADVRAVGLELVGSGRKSRTGRGADAARIWSRVLQATAGTEPGRSISSATSTACAIIANATRSPFGKPTSVRS